MKIILRVLALNLDMNGVLQKKELFWNLKNHLFNRIAIIICILPIQDLIKVKLDLYFGAKLIIVKRVRCLTTVAPFFNYSAAVSA